MSRIERSLLAFLSVDMCHKVMGSKGLQNEDVAGMSRNRSHNVRQLSEPVGYDLALGVLVRKRTAKKTVGNSAMSWYIDFRIGKFSRSWKYHFPAEISLLFTGDHQIVKPYVQEDNQNSERGAFVGFRSTVSKAQKALDQLGLTRAFFESIYDSYRTDLASHCINYLMPRTLTGDALHLAYASYYKIDFLLTWNCQHLANENKKQHIRIINTRMNLFIPDIVTPLELFTEPSYDD